MEETHSVRYIGTCKCRKVHLVERQTRRRFPHPSIYITCLHCTTVKLSLVKGERSERKCDTRCTSARGPKCECECSGANHGAGWVA